MFYLLYYKEHHTNSLKAYLWQVANHRFQYQFVLHFLFSIVGKESNYTAIITSYQLNEIDTNSCR